MSLIGTYDEQNIFAKILRGEIPSVKVLEDDIALAFMDAFPQSEGHTLIIPKKARARNVLEFPAASIGGYFERVQMVAQAVYKALQPDGIILTQFNGASAGQTVFHLHFHVIPRYEAGAAIPHGQGLQAKPEELEAIAARIRAAL